MKQGESYQERLFYEDVYDALTDVVRALGGPKAVGGVFWPQKEPERAAQDVRNCLNRNHSQKFDPEQLLLLFRMAGEAGCHIGMYYFSTQCGYAEPTWREPEDQIAELEREFIESVRLQQIICKRMERLRS